MSKLDREVKELAEAEAKALGLKVSFTIGTKHVIMLVEGFGQKRQIAVAGTPRSSHQRNWVRQDLRKVHRELSAAPAV